MNINMNIHFVTINMNAYSHYKHEYMLSLWTWWQVVTKNKIACSHYGYEYKKSLKHEYYNMLWLKTWTGIHVVKPDGFNILFKSFSLYNFKSKVLKLFLFYLLSDKYKFTIIQSKTYKLISHQNKFIYWPPIWITWYFSERWVRDVVNEDPRLQTSQL